MKKMFVLYFICICAVIIIIMFAIFTHNKYSNLKCYYDKTGLLELIDAEQLECEIINSKIQNNKKENFTMIFFELRVHEKEILENIYFCDKQDEVPSFVMNELTKYGVSQNSILETGINYKDFVIERKNETEFRPYSIYWIKINQNIQSKGNILIYTIVPAQVDELL